MPEPERTFETYRVPATCRDCGEVFETLAFSAEPVQRWGYCEACAYAANQRAIARERVPDPLKKNREVTELEPPRRIWEPD